MLITKAPPIRLINSATEVTARQLLPQRKGTDKCAHGISQTASYITLWFLLASNGKCLLHFVRSQYAEIH
jgi:hypothetical protein